MGDHIESTDGVNVHGLTPESIGAMSAGYLSYIQKLYSNVSSRVNLNLSDIYFIQDQMALNIAEMNKLKLEMAELKRIATLSALSAKHVQEDLDMEWLVEHNLGDEGVTNPTVLCVNINGDMVIPDSIEHIDENSMIISFSLPLKGRAYVLGR